MTRRTKALWIAAWVTVNFSLLGVANYALQGGWG